MAGALSGHDRNPGHDLGLHARSCVVDGGVRRLTVVAPRAKEWLHHDSGSPSSVRLGVQRECQTEW